MKAIIHCHSSFSFDSLASIENIIESCVSFDVKLLILSDHNTVSGSLLAAKKIAELNLNIICPPAAEYKTEFGDVILVGYPYDLISHNFSDLINASHNPGCFLLLPHPFHDHTNIQFLCKNVDFIEVFNSRCNASQNKLALELALFNSKPTYASPDAHFISEYSNCIVNYSVELSTDLSDILQSDWSYVIKKNSSIANIYRSSFIKGYKNGSFIICFKALIKLSIIFCGLAHLRRLYK